MEREECMAFRKALIMVGNFGEIKVSFSEYHLRIHKTHISGGMEYSGNGSGAGSPCEGLEGSFCSRKVIKS